MATRTSRTTAKNPKNPDTPAADSIKVQRTAKCRTLGNGSQLTYEVGADAKQQPHVRMTAAAGGGFFSQEWIALSSIITALDAWPVERPLTSNALAPLFRGKSANNPSFLAAVLVAEGVLQRKANRKRHLERGNDALAKVPATKAKRRPREGGGQKSKKVSGAKSATDRQPTVSPSDTKKSS